VELDLRVDSTAFRREVNGLFASAGARTEVQSLRSPALALLFALFHDRRREFQIGGGRVVSTHV
jgi:hypothetical protein